MPRAFCAAVAKQRSKHVPEELEPYRQWRGTPEETRPLGVWKLGNRLEIKSHRFIQFPEHVLERIALNGDIQIQANGVPFAVAAFCVTAKHPRHWSVLPYLRGTVDSCVGPSTGAPWNIDRRHRSLPIRNMASSYGGSNRMFLWRGVTPLAIRWTAPNMTPYQCPPSLDKTAANWLFEGSRRFDVSACGRS